jgi:hypothetical protein
MTTYGTWTWRFENSAGEPVESNTASVDFPNQADAESWIGETWAELLADGVDSVSLFEEDRLVYGPMSLHPATPAE